MRFWIIPAGAAVLGSIFSRSAGVKVRTPWSRLLPRLAHRLDQAAFPQNDAYFPAEGSVLWNPRNIIQPEEATQQTGQKWMNPFPMPSCYGRVIEEMTISTLQLHLQEGALTSRQLVKCYLSRIEQINSWTSSVLDVNPDALEIADRLDMERTRGGIRGPLHGIPFLLKDNIATDDKMATTAGSLSLMGSRVPRDAHVVTLLREAGGILLGKTNMDEFASARFTSLSMQYSARGGFARNVYNLSSSPWGSSSGSAHGLAANMAAFAIGTETGASIVGPARRAGVVGIKPTLGLTSRAGVIPYTLQQDSVGVFGRYVEDAAVALQGIVGRAAHEGFGERCQPITSGYYTAELPKADFLKGLRLGVPWKSSWVSPTRPVLLGDDQVLPKVFNRLRESGAILVNGTEFPHYRDFRYTNPPYLMSFQYRWDVDFYNDIKTYLQDLKGTHLRSAEDLEAYVQEFETGKTGELWDLHGFPPGTSGFARAVLTKGERNSTYWENERFLRAASGPEGMEAALDGIGSNYLPVRALLLPILVGTFNPTALGGYPIISVPVGISPHDNVPVSIGIAGRKCDEKFLIDVASAIEDLIRARRSPTFVNFWDRRPPVTAFEKRGP